MSIRARMTLGFASICIVFVIFVIITNIIALDVHRHMHGTTAQRMPTTQGLMRLDSRIQESIAALQGWMVTGDERYKHQRAAVWAEIALLIEDINRLSRHWDDRERPAQWRQSKRLMEAVRAVQARIEGIAHSGHAHPALQRFLQEGVPFADTLYRAATRMIDLEKALPAQGKRKELLGLMADMRGSLGQGMTMLFTYLLTADKAHRNTLGRLRELGSQRYQALGASAAALSPEQARIYQEYGDGLAQLWYLADEVVAARDSDRWYQADHLLRTEAVPVTSKLHDILVGPVGEDGLHRGGLVGTEIQLLADAGDTATSAIGLLRQASWVLLSVSLLLAGLIGFYSSRAIIGPVDQMVTAMAAIARGDHAVVLPDHEKTSELGSIARALGEITQTMRSVTDACTAIATGDLSRKIKVRSARDDLALAVNRMVDTFHEIVAQAKAISRGDYAQSVKLRSDKDELGRALAEMNQALRAAQETNQRETWLRTGQREVMQVMQGEQDIPTLSASIIATLAKHLDAQVGVFYVGGQDTGVFRLTGSYAHIRRKALRSEIAAGEGLVGQAIMEKQPIVVSEVPEEYLCIESGLGRAVPRNLVVVPCVQGGEVRGVLELGCVRTLDDSHLELLRLVSESVAIGVGAAQNLQRIRELLQTTQQQSEQMRQQAEALRAANEELEEQTARLEQSRYELQAQSAELEAINAKLEERTELLKRQKQDIEQKNQVLEAARHELADQARVLERTSRYKSEFLANMSHELRTPLNSLLILAKLLSDNPDGNLTAEQVSSAKVIYSGGVDLLALINDILDLSKVEAGMLDIAVEDVPLELLVSRLGAHFEPMASDKGLGFDITVAQGVPIAVRTDRLRLEQIVRNLVGNALKFTSTGSVRLEVRRPGPEVVLRSVSCPRDQVIGFAVIDTGIGIPESRQQEIFEAFQQADGSTSRTYGGTGLGLTISRELARLLGGEIQLSSQEGQGSTFVLYVPEQYPAQAAAHPATGSMPAPSPAAARAHTAVVRNTADAVAARDIAGAVYSIATTATRDTATAHSIATTATRDTATTADTAADDRTTIVEGDRVVLIIEDDPRFADTLASVSRSRGYKCLLAYSGMAGLRLADEYRPIAIFLDLILPDIDGLAVLEQLKFDLTTRHVPVHVISAREERAVALRKGAIGYVRKPASLDDLGGVFTRLEEHLRTPVKSVLVVEDDDSGRAAVVQLIHSNDRTIVTVSTAEETMAALRGQRFDCVILDLELPDMSGFELMRRLRADAALEVPPVIVYTGRELTREEHLELSEYTSSIVIKGANSPERLVDEASLFLHSVESSLPPSQRRMIRILHDPDQVLQNRRVLLVDDNLRNAFALSGVLKRCGMEVMIADNGQLALDRLESGEPIDIILMDVMMPVMDGYETMRRIRANPRLAHIPIIALTAKAMVEDRLRCLEAGANDYLSKPVDTEQLMALMRVWMFGAR